MKKIKVITVDDEGPALRRLNKMVAQQSELKLVGSARSGAEAVAQIRAKPVDLLLLDIELKDATAFEVLQGVKDCFQGRVIFITAYDSYALKAFEVGALDYLLKPYDEARFSTSVARVLEQSAGMVVEEMLRHLTPQVPDARICITEGSRRHFIDPRHLAFIKAEGYYSELNLEGEKKLLRVSLKELSQTLPSQFKRIHKSYIINIHHIEQLIRHRKNVKLILRGGMEFSVSKTYLSNLKALI